MSRDWSKPSNLARWGWGFTALNVLLLLMNLAVLAFFDGSWLNVAAAVFISWCSVLTWRNWRKDVARDARHRAFMAELDRRWLA